MRLATTLRWCTGASLIIAMLTSAALGQAALDMDGADAEAQGWQRCFADDFNRTDLGRNWRTIRGTWALRNGMLCADASAHIILTWQFQGDVRLEYEAITDDAAPSDLSAVLNSDLSRETSGYYFGFGSRENTLSFLIVRGGIVDQADVRIVPGKRHRVVCQREGNRLTMSVDGQVVVSHVHEKPIENAEHSRIGFSVYAPGRFDAVRIYTKENSLALPPTAGASRVQSFEVTGFEVADPLFEELFSPRPTPGVFAPYGNKYDGRTNTRGAISIQRHRHAARRFGRRYVLAEQLDEAAEYRLILHGHKDDPPFKQRGILTRHPVVDVERERPLICLPDEDLPPVYRGGGWIMDPRYLKELVRQAEERAAKGQTDYAEHFDEIWTGFVIKPVPRELWYPQVFEADREIREHYGFGKFGIPDSFTEGDPFDRIAFARWAWDKLTPVFVDGYAAAKRANPDMMIMGPTHGSTATSGDIEAWSAGLDIYGGQTVGAQTNTLFDWVRPGCNTKLYVDLSGIPTWMMVHMSKRQMPVRDAEYMREAYSQVFRNGGENVWLMHMEFFDREIEDAMFAEPSKWHAMLELVKAIRDMRLPRMPEVADTAILFSAITTVTDQWGGLSGDNDRHISAYAALGPCLRNWFHFVSDRQIVRGTRDPSDYKTIFVPWATYEYPELLEKFKAYARDGGTLVITDDDAFTWNINGEPFGAAWEDRSGVRRGAPRTDEAVMTVSSTQHLELADGFTLSALVPGFELEVLADDVVAVAHFPDGRPAITMHPYGRGKVYFFAADPLYARYEYPKKWSTVAEGSPVVEFFRAIQKSAGVTFDHDIWRFKLPPYRTDIYRKEPGLCLTNNYVYDVNEPLLEPGNCDLKGTYSYSRAPDSIADVDAPHVPFATGHLTNRLRAFETRNKRESPHLARIASERPKWVVAWNDPAPVSITFDLKSAQALSHCRLVYSGAMPALVVEGSPDGRTWTRLASTAEEVAGVDVKDVRLYLDDGFRSGQAENATRTDGPFRHVRCAFRTRNATDPFELSEVEIWGTLPRQQPR